MKPFSGNEITFGIFTTIIGQSLLLCKLLHSKSRYFHAIISEWSRDRKTKGKVAPDEPISKKSLKALKKHQRKAKVTVANSRLPTGPMNTDYDLDATKRNTHLNEKARADSLRQLYPDMKNIPDRITRKELTTLVSRHKSARRIQIKMDSLPEVTEARRKEVARNLGGFSNSDPIFID